MSIKLKYIFIITIFVIVIILHSKTMKIYSDKPNHISEMKVDLIKLFYFMFSMCYAGLGNFDETTLFQNILFGIFLLIRYCNNPNCYTTKDTDVSDKNNNDNI